MAKLTPSHLQKYRTDDYGVRRCLGRKLGTARGCLRFADPDDEHVVAAAAVGGAGAIVTANLKDFPSVKIPPHIKVLSPSQFAADTVSVAPDLARRALQAMVNRFSAPPLTIDEILNRLVERYRMVEAAGLIRTVN
jgi:hypothetical protein